MAFRAAFSSLRAPAGLSLFGLSRSYSSTPSGTTTHFLIRRPSPAATRESPFPIIFVRAPGLDAQATEDEPWTDWSAMFAEKGYTGVEVDVQPGAYSEKPFAMMVGTLATQIRTLAIPFAPIIVASGQSCLLTQKYIESYPAAGLVLVNPPADLDLRNDKEKAKWEWPALSYEPTFPILVIADETKLKALEGKSRLLEAAATAGVGRGGKGVSVETLVDGPRGEKSRVEVELWMDRCGY